MNARKLLYALNALPFVAFLVLQVPCSAQSTAGSNYVVSVRDLKMDGKSRAAFDKGSRMLAKGDTANSIGYLQQAVAQFPEHYKAYYDLGVAYFRMGQTAEAEQAFQKSIDITGGNFAPPQFGLGALLCQQQEFMRAATILQRAVDLDPASAVGKYYLSWAQFGLNRLIEAERSAEQASLRNATMAEPYLLLARIHQRQQNSPAVLKDLELYLQLEPNKDLGRRLAQRIREEMAQSPSAALVGANHP